MQDAKCALSRHGDSKGGHLGPCREGASVPCHFVPCRLGVPMLSAHYNDNY